MDGWHRFAPDGAFRVILVNPCHRFSTQLSRANFSFETFSTVFRLPEGRMLSYFGIVSSGSILDVPNATLGLGYYAIWHMFLLPFFPKQIRLLVDSLALASSGFLATRLILLSELCVLCWSIHVINARLWWATFSSILSSSKTNRRLASSSSSGGGGVRESAKIKRV